MSEIKDLRCWAWERARKLNQQVPNTGILYLEDLQGPDGAHFTLFVTDHTRDEINRAKSLCRHHWDVTGFTIIRTKDL